MVVIEEITDEGSEPVSQPAPPAASQKAAQQRNDSDAAAAAAPDEAVGKAPVYFALSVAAWGGVILVLQLLLAAYFGATKGGKAGLPFVGQGVCATVVALMSSTLMMTGKPMRVKFGQALAFVVESAFTKIFVDIAMSGPALVLAIAYWAMAFFGLVALVLAWKLKDVTAEDIVKEKSS
eukprot:TRINITY_DN42498_c0_g1_i1.p1 TRINITY_DN42498_c0_g1~~TRINITY_DN42498_c0_g1_i1.p1  ORF type:complete len:179 (-),score=62.97 TRINITY_DN42498_c0_g1_i1:444-980(-)